MNHFIKLPDGTIINVAHVESVDTETHKDSVGLVIAKYTVIGLASGESHKIKDPNGAIYAFFNSIAQVIGGEEK